MSWCSPLGEGAGFVCHIIRLRYTSHNRTRPGVYLIHGIMEIRPVLFSGHLIPQRLTDLMKISWLVSSPSFTMTPSYPRRLQTSDFPFSNTLGNPVSVMVIPSLIISNSQRGNDMKPNMWIVAFAWHQTSVRLSWSALPSEEALDYVIYLHPKASE